MVENNSLAMSRNLDVSLPDWSKQDTIWTLSLFGTAIGAGTLFLPIGAGLSGIWPMLVMLLLCFPMTYYSHRALCRFVLSGSSTNSDITQVVDEHFGRKSGHVLTLLYFFAIYPILLMYSVAITNTTESFLVHQLNWTAPPRVLLSLALILGLMGIVYFGQQVIVKSMSILVYPFITILILLALYLVPHWNNSIFTSPMVSPEGHGFWTTLWLIIPVMVFSFNHSPIISSFALQQKKTYGAQAEERSCRILRNSHLLMVITVMFFVFSCVLSLSPQNLLEAKQQNISILSYLANHFQTPIIAYIAPFIAFIAISKSFLGHYLGASEGLNSLIQRLSESPKTKFTNRLMIDGFIIITCWIIATLNPSILSMIETLGGPVITGILFLMPIYAMRKVKALQPYRQKLPDGFLLLIGLISISALVYGLFC